MLPVKLGEGAPPSPGHLAVRVQLYEDELRLSGSESAVGSDVRTGKWENARDAGVGTAVGAREGATAPGTADVSSLHCGGRPPPPPCTSNGWRARRRLCGPRGRQRAAPFALERACDGAPRSAGPRAPVRGRRGRRGRGGGAGVREQRAPRAQQRPVAAPDGRGARQWQATRGSWRAPGRAAEHQPEAQRGGARQSGRPRSAGPSAPRTRASVGPTGRSAPPRPPPTLSATG